jgi:hypothetical protein
MKNGLFRRPKLTLSCSARGRKEGQAYRQAENCSFRPMFGDRKMRIFPDQWEW